MNSKKKISLYDTGLMFSSILVILAMIAALTLYPNWGSQLAAQCLSFMTLRFGSLLQLLGVVALVFLLALACSKYGNIRLGSGKPEYSNASWYAMMFFAGNGAGTLYWVFLEWGYHFNAKLQPSGASMTEASNYEHALAYTLFDWGPAMWAVCALFIVPFAYHYYIKKNSQLKLSQVCKYSIGDNRANGWLGKLIDFLFIFAAIGSISITAGTSGSAMARTLADAIGISSGLGLTAAILLSAAMLYTVSSLVGIEKGMRRMSDYSIYISSALIIFIFLVGPTQFIIDSIVNSFGIVATDFFRVSLWTDPILHSGYPQSWTDFYLAYFIVFSPFTGLFCAKVSKGRTIRACLLSFIGFCSLGTTVLFGVIGAYQQSIRIRGGGLDVPAMLSHGKGASIASMTLKSLPIQWLPIGLYLIALMFFLATTLDACSFSLSSTVTRHLQVNQEPNKRLKFAWCCILIALPLAITYAGTNINTIKSIVLLTGLPVVLLVFIAYHGILKEMKRDFGALSVDAIKQLPDQG